MLNKHQNTTLARAGDFDLWPIIKTLVQEELDSLRRDMRLYPALCDDDLTKDLRHKIGHASGLEWVLEIPERARKELEKEG